MCCLVRELAAHDHGAGCETGTVEESFDRGGGFGDGGENEDGLGRGGELACEFELAELLEGTEGGAADGGVDILDHAGQGLGVGGVADFAHHPGGGHAELGPGCGGEAVDDPAEVGIAG